MVVYMTSVTEREAARVESLAAYTRWSLWGGMFKNIGPEHEYDSKTRQIATDG